MKYKKIWFYIIIAFFVCWVLGTSILLINASQEFLFYYLLYVMLGILVLFLVRKDIFSPPGLFVMTCFQAFGMNIPFFSAGYLNTSGIYRNVLFTGDASMGDATLAKMLIILLVAQVSFLAGYISPLYKLLPLKIVLSSDHQTKKASLHFFVLILIAVVIAGIIRIQFHLGEAGVQPTIPMAGLVQYICYNGVLILCLYFLAQGMRQGAVYTFLGLLPVLGMAFTQVLLSWRGGIVQMLIIIFFLFWNNQNQTKSNSQHNKKRVRPLIWLLLLLIIAPVFIQIGNSIRSDRLGGESSFAGSNAEFIFNILNRSQGSTRMAVVVNDIGPISFTNDYKFIDLFKIGKTNTRYIDEKLYGVLPHQSHSVGTSGPGGAYVAFGIIGVFLGYSFLGIFYRSGYVCMRNSNSENVLGIVWYALMALILFDNMSENFNITSIKLIVALSSLFFINGRLFLIKKRSKK